MKRARKSGPRADPEAAAGAAAKRLVRGFGTLIVAAAKQHKIPEGTAAIAAIGGAGNVLMAERGVEATRDLLRMLADTLADGPGLQ